MVDVTQADREAAAEYYLTRHNPDKPYADLIRSGVIDDKPMVQAFARHRIAARREGMEEAARIVRGYSPADWVTLESAKEDIAKAIREASQ